ncbi:MAG: peptidylprolyl isomerase [Clostridia bacterium]|nr:peptidylprolyl isomerase [Clostridia bacterium]
MKKIICLIISVILCLTLFSCGIDAVPDSDIIRFEMENGGVFYVELYPAHAPETVKNFKKLVNEGFYDGLIFHRVETDILIQGGDPDGDGYGGSDKAIKGEFPSNGFTQNKLKHTEGVISMARTPDPNSATSQFFICVTSLPSLDGDYAAFGKVVQGMDVVRAIASCPVNGSRPIEKQAIKTATIVDSIPSDTDNSEN